MELNLNFVSQDLVHALLYYNIQKAVKLSVKLKLDAPKITVLSEQKFISDTDFSYSLKAAEEGEVIAENAVLLRFLHVSCQQQLTCPSELLKVTEGIRMMVYCQ